MDFKKTTLAVLAGAFISTSAMAVVEGNGNSDGLGAESKAWSDIEMAVEKFGDGDGMVLVDHMDDLDLGTFGDPNATLSDTTDFCIYATGYDDGDTYDDMTVTIGGGSDGLGAFELTGTSSGATVPYSVHFLEGLGASDSDTLANNGLNTFSGLSGVGLTEGDGGIGYNCTAENASLYVSVSTVDASQLPEDTYTGTIAVVVEAE